MTIEDVLKKIGDVGIIPVVRAATFEEASRVVDAVLAGGISIVEITMTIPNATTVIRKVVRQYGDHVLTGAGTVLTADDAHQCLDAGAEFLVSPGVSVPVMSTARACGKLAVPGVLTPTELMNASEFGAKLIKIFPCGHMGGPKYLKSLRGPFPNVLLIPTGGVNASNAVDYMAAGAFALGVGTDLIDIAALREGNSLKITSSARELVDIVKRVRSSIGPSKWV